MENILIFLKTLNIDSFKILIHKEKYILIKCNNINIKIIQTNNIICLYFIQKNNLDTLLGKVIIINVLTENNKNRIKYYLGINNYDNTNNSILNINQNIIIKILVYLDKKTIIKFIYLNKYLINNYNDNNLFWEILYESYNNKKIMIKNNNINWRNTFLKNNN